VGSMFLWFPIDTGQTPNYIQIDTAQSPNYTPIER